MRDETGEVLITAEACAEGMEMRYENREMRIKRMTLKTNVEGLKFFTIQRYFSTRERDQYRFFTSLSVLEVVSTVAIKH